MGSQSEQWLFVKDGKIILHFELDQHSYMRKGPCAKNEIITDESQLSSDLIEEYRMLKANLDKEVL